SAELDEHPVFYWKNIASVIVGILLFLGVGIYKYSNKNNGSGYNSENLNIYKSETKNKNLVLNTPVKKENDPGNNQSESKKNKPITKKNTVLAAVTKKLIAQKNKINSTSHKTAKPNYLNINLSKFETESSETKEIVFNSLQTRPDQLAMNLMPFNTIITTDEITDKEIPVSLSGDFQNNLLDTNLSNGALIVKPKKFEIGITYSYNNTWIINNETQKSFDQNSLTQTFLAFASSYGVVANYNVSNYNALSAEFYFNSTSRQKYGEYIEGTYSQHTLQFNYAKLTLLYQLNINQPRYKKIASKYTFKAGVYGSYLKSYDHSYSRVNFADDDKYKSNDYGIKIAIGQEKKMQNIIFGYGLNAEYGFNNTFAGSKQMPSNFNITKNALVGAYFNLKYNF
ncbi:MAG: hypothetical protein ABIP51_05125, partial [Bacteroidia bacterium]